MKPWKKISSKSVLNHPRMSLEEDIVELPNGSVVPYLKDSVLGRKSVTLFCVRDGQVLLQREYSYPPNTVMYQLPGGGVEAGESLEQAAQRELKEESGYKAGELKEIGSFYTNNRRSDAMMHIFLATELTETEKAGGDAEEEIESEWVPLEELKTMIANGEIINFSILTAWAFYQTRSAS